MVVSGVIKKYGMPEMGMFELAPVGIPIAIVGLIYIYLARRFIPEREPPEKLTEEFGLGDYLSEAVIVENSPLAGKTLAEARLGEELGLNVLRILREKRSLRATREDKVASRRLADDRGQPGVICSRSRTPPASRSRPTCISPILTSRPRTWRWWRPRYCRARR